MNVETVAVLRGGPGAEYDISMQTGAGVLSVLADTEVKVRDIVISHSGQWLVGGFVREPEQALVGVDVAFLALHGTYGEDGVVQRLLDRLSVPYTGSGPYASAIAMNKALTKEHLTEHGIKTPQYMRVTRVGVTDPVKTALSIGLLFGPRYVVKPTAEGSSIGIKIANNMHELGSILAKLLEEYEDIIVEELIEGREATVGVLENYRDTRLYHLPVVEIIPPEEAGFFAAEVKYTGETQEICPGRFTKPEKEELARIAMLAHKELNLRHYSRSDFIVAKDGIYFLEVNTLPGLTSESLFPKAVDAVGGSYTELVRHLITQAASGTV